MPPFPDPDPSPSKVELLLEIKIFRTAAQTYDVELQLEQLGSEMKDPPVRGPAAIQPKDLAPLRPRTQEYGEALFDALFGHPPVRAEYDRARDRAKGITLRINLIIDPSAPELHAIVWELLVDKPSHARIANNLSTPLSRFIYYDRDAAAVPPLRKGAWKVLIAIPDPKSDPDGKYPNNIDVEKLKDEARRSFEGIPSVTVLPSPVTLDTLADAIAAGVDVLYLVCHGSVHPPNKFSKAGDFDFEKGFGPAATVARERDILLPVIYLENTNREVEAVPAGALARRVADLAPASRPRLAVLASCESAGEKDDATGISAQAALAPRLARAGIPAIIAMQGKISVETAGTFMKEFFQQVVDHGSIDQAVSAARGKVASALDSWMPALFSRLRYGRLWYKAAFTPGAKWEFKRICDEIEEGSFTPIIGWGLGEKIYGTKSDLSARLAAERNVPFQAHRLGELALVSQYLKLAPGDITLLKALKESIRRDVVARFADRIPSDTKNINDALEKALALFKDDKSDPYRIVAHLPAKVFINACQDNLLEEALRAAGKTPVVKCADWRYDRPAAAYESLDPSVDSPLILHVFGRFSDPDSLVLTEDDYLEFLMGIKGNQALLSSAAKFALTNKALMFLGFQLTDWSFRVLFRIVMKLLPGASNSDNKPSVAVQIDPDDSIFAGPEEARDFFQRFYRLGNIEAYWGTSEDFLTTLWPSIELILKNR